MKIPQHLIFMKVGTHAGESFEQILERKARELRDAGRIFWGYGGAACHPFQQVQPFAKLSLRDQTGIMLVMEFIDSKANPEIVPATEYSEDGITWQTVPKGIRVTGSRYALILDEIKPGDFILPTSDFAVGIGPNRGKIASDYLKGRVDKACLTRVVNNVPAESLPHKKISYTASLLSPYAVMLR